jgi:hypothetical protein
MPVKFDRLLIQNGVVSAFLTRIRSLWVRSRPVGWLCSRVLVAFKERDRRHGGLKVWIGDGFRRGVVCRSWWGVKHQIPLLMRLKRAVHGVPCKSSDNQGDL